MHNTHIQTQGRMCPPRFVHEKVTVTNIVQAQVQGKLYISYTDTKDKKTISLELYLT